MGMLFDMSSYIVKVSFKFYFQEIKEKARLICLIFCLMQNL